ncbi:10692_t:CDS:1, partial [Gigaspora rosea]
SEIIHESLIIESSILSGTSTTSYIEAERLFELLNSKKDDIDHILDSQPVYVIAPDFREGHSVPHIVCWATEPLDISIIEQLKGVFQDEFEVVVIIMDQENHTYRGEPLNSNIYVNGSTSNYSSSSNVNSGDKQTDKKEYSNGEDGGDDGYNSRDNNEGDGFGRNYRIDNENIRNINEFDIRSTATAFIDKKCYGLKTRCRENNTKKVINSDNWNNGKINIQSFEIQSKINAEVTSSNTQKILTYNVDLHKCEIDYIKNGFFLDSVAIIVEPHPNNVDGSNYEQIFNAKKPGRIPRVVEHTVGMSQNCEMNVQVTDKHVSQDFGILAKFNAK